MSIENQRECFESLNQMLKRTQHSKSITNPGVVWQYENIASVFMRGIILTSPRIETPAYIGYTPQRRTPINSIHNTPIPERGTGYQSSYTPHSIVGDVSRMSVGAAMNHHTRNTIDREISRENARLQQIPFSQAQHTSRDHAYHDTHMAPPDFLTRQRIEHPINLVQHNQQTDTCAKNRPKKKRPRSPDKDEHNHDKALNKIKNPKCASKRCRYPSHNERDDNQNRQNSSSESDDSDDSEDSEDSDDSDIEESTIFDPYDRQPWIVYNRRIHEKISDNRMILPSSSGQRVTAEVIYNPSNPNYFRTKPISDTTEMTPFLGATEAHSMLMRAFNLRASDAISPNKALRIMDSQLSPSSGLNQLLELIKSHDAAMTKTAYSKTEKQLLTSFPEAAFDSISVINLKNGWPFQGDNYMEWAKDKSLSIDEFKDYIRFEFDTSACTPELLNKERESRRLLVNQFTSIHLIELYSSKVGKLEKSTKTKHNLSSEEGNAIAQTMLPTTKYLTARWMKAKMDVRYALFNGLPKHHWLSSLQWIMKSSLWDSSIFPKSAIDQMRYEASNDVAEKLGLVGLTGSKNVQQPSYKKAKRFQNQPGTFQTQQQQNGHNKNFQQKFFREGQQQNFQGNRRKKGSKQKQKGYNKAKHFKGKGSKGKQNYAKKYPKNNNKNAKQEK